MKKIFIEYINIIGYAITGLVFGLSFFLLFINFYHNKEIAEVYVKNDDYVDVYTKNKDKIEQVKKNISTFNANNYRGEVDQATLMNIKAKLDMCVSKYESTDANKIFTKKEINLQDDYDLLGYYQSDIVNDCVTLQLYSITVPNNTVRLGSFNQIKPFINISSKILMYDLDYVKRNLQTSSTYSFSSDYDKANIFNMTRDSYTRIESSYDSSLNLLLEVSEWFKKVIGGEV